MKRLILALSFFCTLALLASCSAPEREAKKELKAKGIEPTSFYLVSEAGKGNLENVKLLLTAGVPVDAPGSQGDAALTSAASKGHTAVIRLLLAAGADKNKSGRDGDTALIRAVKMDRTDAAAALIQAGSRSDITDNDDKSALDIAIGKKNWPMVIALGKSGVNLDQLDEDGQTRLMAAIVNDEGNNELIETLIRGGADCNLADKNGNTPFTEAVNRNKHESIVLMAQYGADINGILFKHKAYSALMTAIEMKRPELAKALIEARSDVNFMIEETQDSCLFRAVYNKQKDMVVMLIAAGADVNTKNNFLETPLSRSTADAEGKDLAIADILLKAGADINAIVSDKGGTSLHLAVRQSDKLLDSLRYLLQNGAATDIYDNDGHTPLTLAVLHKKPDAVSALIEAGADVNFPAMTGLKPFNMAERLDNRKITGMLRRAGATK